MYAKRIMLLFFSCFCYMIGFSQTTVNEQGANAKSLQLYEEKKWAELLQFGKSALEEGMDFPLLRMRTGFAAFVLGNYSESLKQYQNVYDKDPQNNIAQYYVYLANIYLNNLAASGYYAGQMPEETRTSEKIKKYKFSSLELEYSFKSPDIDGRGNAQYGRVGLNIQLGYRLGLQQSVAFYNQVISEPKLTAVTNNTNIDISQKEYYMKLIFAASGKLSLVGGLHYLYNPFNNFIYNNVAGFAGAKYSTPYIQFQGMINLASIRDSSYTQLDVALTTYPLGNTNLYTISKASYGDDFTFTQIAGIKLWKNAWLEANVTAGQYKILLANDALYLFDDIDTKRFKAGGSLYILLAKKVMVSANFNFEQKERFGSAKSYFHQYSTTGGLTWNF